MSASPHDLLQLSTRLLTADCDEVTRRCVVSRAYYAALHAVQCTFEERLQESSGDHESTHARVIGRAVAYANQQRPGRMYAAEIAKIMPRLRRTRNIADYHLDVSFESPLCSDVTAKAQRVLALCGDVERLRAGSTKAAE
jgi:hypothetical protein